MGKDKVQAAKSKKVKKGDLKEFQAEDPTVYFELFKQLKDQFYKEKGQKSTLETLKESLGGAVLKDVTFFYQKLNKKSTETIVRTLKEFYDMLSQKEADFFKALMASYSIIHEKLLTTEFERDVFLHVLRIDDLIIKKNRDAIRQHFKIFYPAWYLMQHEILGDIQAQAKRNLLELFPDSDKHIAAFFVCHQNYLNMISTWLTQPAKQFKDINLFLDDDDCERVHSRLLGLTFRSMEASVILLGEFEDREEYTNKLASLLKFDDPGNLLVELFNRYKKDFSLRSEIASFYSTLIKEDVEDFEHKQSLSIIKNFLANLDVKEPLLQQVFWQKGLVEDMLPGMQDKFDQLEMPKVYKRIQTILEVGGLSIGIDFFKNVNSFLLQSPLFDFRSASSSKKFCGPLGDNFKLIEGFVKAYFSTLELDSCKFIMKDLIQTYFDFAYHVLVEVALKTRADIKKGTLYNDAELTEPLKKSIDSFFEKLTDLLLVSPLELYLERNSPDNQSEFAVGINNYKFLPKLYAKFMQRLVECAEAETISNNQDLLERSFGKFAQSVAELAKDKRKFESFLILIDGLASEKITPTTLEAKSVYSIVARLFDNSSKFLEAFASEKLIIENLEKQFSVETFSNFKKYLSNILASNSDLNLDISARIVPKVVKNLVTVLTESLDEYFEMFEDESLRNDIIQTLFSVYYLIVDWQAKKDQLDLQALGQVFGALNKHVVEISNTDEVSLGNGKNKGAFIVVVSALTPYTKVSKLADLWKLKGQELKEAAVTIQEGTTGVAGFKATCKHLSKSKEFVQVATGVVKKFLLGRTIQMINLYDVAWRLSEFVPEDSMMKIWPQTLHANNNKDEYVRYKLAILDQLYSKTSAQNAQKQAGLLFSYLNESKSFPSDTIICKVEKFFSLTEKSFRNAIVLNFGQVLKDYLGDSSDQSITDDNRRGILQAFGFYLTRFIQEEDLTEDTYLKLFEMFMTETNFKGSLHRGFFWNTIRVIAESCGKVCKLPGYMQSYLKSKDRREVLYALLASPSCLQIVLNYDLKKYFFDFNSQNLLPVFQEVAQKSLEEFKNILKEILDLAVTVDIQYVYGLKTILLDFTRSDSIDAAAKQSIFLTVMDHLRSHQKAVPSDSLSSFIELTSNVTNYFHENCFRLADVLAFKVDLKSKIRRALKLESEAADSGSGAAAESADYSGLSTQDLLFDLTVYLSICRHSRVNGLADLCPFMFAAVKPEAAIFPGVKREVLLCLLFRMLNSAIEDNEFVKITDRISQIEDSYREGLSLSSFGEQKNLLLVSLLEFLRKVITIIEMFSKDFEEGIQGHIMDTAISKVTQLKEIRGSNNDHFASYGCGFDELLVEIAETLARFSLTYSGKISEDQLYILLDCGVPVVQKSAWMILHDLYTNRISPSKLAQDDEEFEAVCKTKGHITPELLRIIETRAAALEDQIAAKNPKKKQGKQGSEILEIKLANEGLDLGIFSFALSWIAIMTKSKTNRLEGSQDQKYLEAVLNNFSELYSGLLTSIFKWINDLKIPGKALEKKLDSMEIREIPLDWTEYIDHDTVFTLLLHTFFKFTSSFPKFLRQWMNFADKRYTSLALFVVRHKISNMILDYEIAEIEAKEPVWSSEEFSIMSFRNTREIEAVYNKENAKLSMKFYLPDSYPVE